MPTEFSDYINVLSLSKPLDFLDSFRISSYGTDRIVNLKSRQASVVYSTVTIPATVYFESGIQYISFAILITGERARLQGNNSHIDYHGGGANFNCFFFAVDWEENLYKIKENKQGSALVINSAQITLCRITHAMISALEEKEYERAKKWF